MTPFEIELCRRLFDEARDRLGNRGCNDFELPNTPESIALLNAIERDNVGPGHEPEFVYVFDPSKKRLCAMDFSVFRYLTKKLLAGAAQRASAFSITVND